MILAFVFIMTLMIGVLFTTGSMIAVTVVTLVENLCFLPRMTLTGNSSEEQTGGEQVKSFHLRRV